MLIEFLPVLISLFYQAFEQTFLQMPKSMKIVLSNLSKKASYLLTCKQLYRKITGKLIHIFSQWPDV